MLPASLHRPWLPMSFRKGMHQPTGLIDEFHEYIFGFLYESQDFQILSNQTRWDMYGSVMIFPWEYHMEHRKSNLLYSRAVFQNMSNQGA